MTGVHWKSVDGFPGYEVSADGQVRSPSGRVLMPQRNGRYGYLKVALGRSNQRYIHRLVAAAFIGPVEGMDVDHIDGDTANNVVTNLRILTHAENMSVQRERKPVCKRGHSFTDAYWNSKGRRQCRTCTQDAARRRYAEKRRGKGDPGDQYVTLTLRDFAILLGAEVDA